MKAFDTIKKMLGYEYAATQVASLEQEIAAKRIRNEARIKQIKQEMGDKYILAECNKKSRLDNPRPV